MSEPRVRKTRSASKGHEISGFLAKVKEQAQRLDSIGHLGPEAVVAFVDEEMPPKYMHRVRVHVVHCPECRAEVHRQRRASEWIRCNNGEDQVRAPHHLLTRLNSIAQAGTVSQSAPGERDFFPGFMPKQDFLDKLEMVRRALKRQPRD